MMPPSPKAAQKMLQSFDSFSSFCQQFTISEKSEKSSITSILLNSYTAETVGQNHKPGPSQLQQGQFRTKSASELLFSLNCFKSGCCLHSKTKRTGPIVAILSSIIDAPHKIGLQFFMYIDGRLCFLVLNFLFSLPLINMHDRLF